MLTLTGNGRLTRDVQLRSTHSGKTVTTISIASDRRDRDAQPIYIDLVVWGAQADAAAKHLTKGQAVSFAGRFEPREYVTNAGDQRIALELHDVAIEYVTNAGDQRIALELHDVAIEYGAKPRSREPDQQPATADAAGGPADIPF